MKENDCTATQGTVRSGNSVKRDGTNFYNFNAKKKNAILKRVSNILTGLKKWEISMAIVCMRSFQDVIWWMVDISADDIVK